MSSKYGSGTFEPTVDYSTPFDKFLSEYRSGTFEPMVDYSTPFDKFLSDELQKLQNIKPMAYKVFNLKDLLSQIQYTGVRKGTKTEAYLEDVINFINLTRKYKWVQFFQLIDVFYVVVELLPSQESTFDQEIKNHYNPGNTDKKAELPIAEKQVSEQVVIKKGDFPWKKK